MTDDTPCSDKGKEISTIYYLVAADAQRTKGVFTGDSVIQKHILYLPPNSLWSYSWIRVGHPRRQILSGHQPGESWRGGNPAGSRVYRAA